MNKSNDQHKPDINRETVIPCCRRVNLIVAISAF